jgi:hypothetical protein
MGELPPGLDLDNLDQLLASLTPETAAALGIQDTGGSGDGESMRDAARDVGRETRCLCCVLLRLPCLCLQIRPSGGALCPAHPVMCTICGAPPRRDPRPKTRVLRAGVCKQTSPSKAIFCEHADSTCCIRDATRESGLPLDLRAMSPGQLAEELAKRVAERVQSRLMVRLRT